MEALGETPKQPRNRILRALDENEYAELRRYMELVRFDVRELIYDLDTPIEHVIFPETGVLSIVNVMADGSALETATVGNEGMVGIPVFLDTDRSASQAFCQVRADGLRMRTPDFRRAVNDGNGLRTMMNRYTQALFTQVAQSAACNRLHTVKQRCARWLLQTHDRVDGDVFPLTQEFLSQMLGVRRATVNEAATSLQDDGLIEYRYGQITIKDRAALERGSCECYDIVRSEFDRLLEGRRTPSPLDGVKASSDGKSTLNDGSPRRDPEMARDE